MVRLPQAELGNTFTLLYAVGTDAPLPTSPRWGEEPDTLPQLGRGGVGARKKEPITTPPA